MVEVELEWLYGLIVFGGDVFFWDVVVFFDLEC